MPELPEVETVRRGLQPVLEGELIARVRLNRKDLRFPFPEGFVERLSGARVEKLSRRAKYLVGELSTGEALIMHLGMTGRFLIRQPGDAAPQQIGEYEYATGGGDKHAHVIIETSRGAEVTYSDPRRFGFMLLCPQRDLEAHALFRNLGVEPLGDALTAAYLASRAANKKTDLKAFLMDQRVVAGLGNIYVSEALFRAGLKPTRKSASLALRSGAPSAHSERLVPEIRAVLMAALQAGGSTLRDYRHADGTSGAFQDAFMVYGREGEPCLRPGCRGTVRKCVQAGRSTFFCPACQK